MIREKRKTIIVGGGASGMMAAISAARRGSRVTVLEQKNCIGKKLLVTGNGRCNFTNRVQREDCYRTGTTGFPKAVLNQFTAEDTLSFFTELGMQIKERNGYYYPYSGQAETVLLVLKKEMERLRVQIETGAKVDRIEKKESSFFCFLTDGRLFCGNQLILSAGSMASPKTGSDGSGYRLAEELGHHLVRPLPALCPIEGTAGYRKQVGKEMAGVRTDAILRLLVENKPVYEERGELQLTEYGLSGIPVFQFSRYAVRAYEEKKDVCVLIDFLPDMEREKCRILIRRQMKHYQKTVKEAVEGLLNRKIAAAVLACAGIGVTERKLTEQQENVLLSCLKEFVVIMTGYRGYEQAQVCSGGIAAEEVKEKTLESKLVKGLYFAGEILDVDGACGGYNLQWAWASGYVAGQGL